MAINLTDNEIIREVVHNNNAGLSANETADATELIAEAETATEEWAEANDLDDTTEVVISVARAEALWRIRRYFRGPQAAAADLQIAAKLRADALIQASVDEDNPKNLEYRTAAEKSAERFAQRWGLPVDDLDIEYLVDLDTLFRASARWNPGNSAALSAALNDYRGRLERDAGKRT